MQIKPIFQEHFAGKQKTTAMKWPPKVRRKGESGNQEGLASVLSRRQALQPLFRAAVV